jgi:hypothetical protein
MPFDASNRTNERAQAEPVSEVALGLGVPYNACTRHVGAF